MNIKKLRCFRAVVIHGSLVAAASVMNLSQPATSRLISTLEDELKLKLFKREKRRLVLTPEGKEFYREAEKILANLDDLPRIVREIKDGGTRTLRIVALARLANSLVSPALARFVAENPEQRFSVDVRGHRDIEQWVAGRHYDIAVALTKPCNHPSVIQRPFFDTDAMAMVPKGHPLELLESVTAEQMAEHDIIALAPGLRPRFQMEEIFHSAGVELTCKIETTSSVLACQMVVEGLGVTIIDRLAALAVDESRYSLLPLNPSYRLQFVLLFPPGFEETPATKSLVRCLSNQVRESLGEHAVMTSDTD
ncbi:LysR family transcriptional regulator [Marinobacter adhaerens]|jgi:DNA-binding transcriptional LysR family regulator|uniref:LysR family transcriptional regulator n=1 Tax=Marinobacter adhaerens TaxID=1033846 RepID=A0ABX8IIS1_9GAMM|nr:LysR family transcriptional regulator [Marinobacter adhaerens]MBW4976921.1 LysR family transcriptional regulator [Marinobacter adhaerens]QWV12564.1 LysR family transcriptional regulator [Marinobacter adhaerens]